jgi:hypothetical protein
VPAPGILRLTVGRYGERRWVALDAPTRRAFNRTLRANAPIAAPTPLLVTIGARPAADATAYRALYGRLPSAPAPAATRPPPTKIVLTTMTPSPWSGGATIRLAYVAKHRLLRRDGQWVRVTPSLARALERDGRIGGNGSRFSLILVAGAVAAAVAASAAATATRRRRATA